MPEQDIQSQYTDDLSPFAREVLKLNLAQAYTQLVVKGPGNAQAMKTLDGATGELMLASPVKDMEEARSMLAGLWLWHDWLDPSHTISQSINTPTGSFWHAIMHRREGDFGNSKYWYARCEGHPVFTALAANAAAFLNPLPADISYLRLTHNGWNASAFVDLVETVHNHPNDPRRETVVGLQQLEWRMLFDSCTRRAAGK
jgi:hypothetical protein